MYSKEFYFQKRGKKRLKTAERLKVIPIILAVWPQSISNPHYTNFSLRNQTPNTNGVYDLKLHTTEYYLYKLDNHSTLPHTCHRLEIHHNQ